RAHFPICVLKLWRACSRFQLRPPPLPPPLPRPDASAGYTPPAPAFPETKFRAPVRTSLFRTPEMKPHSAAETRCVRTRGNFPAGSLPLPPRHPNNRPPRAASAALPSAANPRCSPPAATPPHSHSAPCRSPAALLHHGPAPYYSIYSNSRLVSLVQLEPVRRTWTLFFAIRRHGSRFMEIALRQLRGWKWIEVRPHSSSWSGRSV